MKEDLKIILSDAFRCKREAECATSDKNKAELFRQANARMWEALDRVLLCNAFVAVSERMLADIVKKSVLPPQVAMEAKALLDMHSFVDEPKFRDTIQMSENYSQAKGDLFKKAGIDPVDEMRSGQFFEKAIGAFLIAAAEKGRN